jgi:putative PIN family toxin of toxin-antitoxin system
VIRAVLDASILVSRLPTTTSLPALIIDRWRAGQFRLAVSEHNLDEVERPWRKPCWRARFSPARVERALALLRLEADVVPSAVTVSGVASYPEDDLVLARAVSAHVNVLVTGDRRLQQLAVYEGVALLSPRQVVALLDHDRQD